MDALAEGGDEGRGKRRYASVSGKHALTRGSPNGETHPVEDGISPSEYIGWRGETQGSEPSQYLEEKKENSIP